jgi:hypothetical protein
MNVLSYVVERVALQLRLIDCRCGHQAATRVPTWAFVGIDTARAPLNTVQRSQHSPPISIILLAAGVLHVVCAVSAECEQLSDDEPDQETVN